ncbi:MAG: hypothetical protein ACTSR2_08155, partial [Candidatus Hodarchaeales archaeon]
MTELAQKWNRLPSLAGVTFEGFENVKLESRTVVQNQLESFFHSAVNSDRTFVSFLIADWGEGKTDAYFRYIKPYCTKNNHNTILLPAIQISNSYEVISNDPTLKKINSNAYQLILSIFQSIEAKSSILADLSKIDDPKQYLIEQLFDLTSNGKKHFFIFIDELEDLFLSNEKFLGLFLLSLKELINKNSTLDVDGYNILRNVHFVVCCTPNIYNRIKTRFETIWGGLGRRIKEIELPHVSRYEGLKFLFELLKYSYNGELPGVLPIESEGILSLLHLVSLGNLGTMVKLFSDSIVSCCKEVKDNQIEKLSHDKIIAFLKPQKITVYGGETPAINAEALKSLFETMNDALRKYPPQAKQLLSLMIGEWKPYSIEEIKKRINYRQELTRVINSLNMYFKRNSIPKPIIEVCVFDNLEIIRGELLKDYYKEEPGGQLIDFGNEILEFNEFLEKITHIAIDKNEFKILYIFPLEDEGIKSLFENITEGTLAILKRRINSKYKDEPFYVINPKILQLIYPTPIPLDLNYIKDRQKRLKLWREISLTYQIESLQLPNHLIPILKNHPDFSNIQKLPSVQKLKSISNCQLLNLTYSIDNFSTYTYNVLLYNSSEFTEKDNENIL